MESPKNISDEVSASRLAIANLSVALSFVLATLFSTGAVLQSVVGLRSRIPVLSPLQIQLVEVITAYWLPAIVIYALFRITGFDSRLRTNSRADAFILLGNAIFCTYVAKQGTATTAYEYLAMGMLFIVPAFILFAIGFFTLKSNAVRSRKPIGAGEVMAAIILTIAPVAYLSSSINIEDLYDVPTLSGLCKQAAIKKVATVERPAGLALLPDYFSHYSSNDGGVGHGLLYQQLFEFVEVSRLSDNYNGHFNTAKFERIKPDPSNGVTKYGAMNLIFEPIEMPSAEYEVKITDLAMPEWSKLKLHGKRIDIRKASDQSLVGYAQYYWSTREKIACPPEITGANFVEDFIAGTLGAKTQAHWIK